jgi:DNA-binding transcriptional ArsR family regulator
MKHRRGKMKTALKQPYKQFFGTLANQIRLDILNILIKSDSNVTKIVSQLDYDQTSVSHSLSRLTECGFVTVKKDGKERIYSLRTHEYSRE